MGRDPKTRRFTKSDDSAEMSSLCGEIWNMLIHGVAEAKMIAAYIGKHKEKGTEARVDRAR